MARGVTALLGPARSGKTTALLSRYRRALAEYPPRSTLWIAPTHRAAAQVRQQFVATPIDAAPPNARLAACFSPAVMTFAQFARQVVAAGDQPVQPLSRLASRRLIAQLIREASVSGQLTYLAPIAPHGGFAGPGRGAHSRTETARNLARGIPRRLPAPRQARQGPRAGGVVRRLSAAAQQASVVRRRGPLLDGPRAVARGAATALRATCGWSSWTDSRTSRARSTKSWKSWRSASRSCF